MYITVQYSKGVQYATVYIYIAMVERSGVCVYVCVCVIVPMLFYKEEMMRDYYLLFILYMYCTVYNFCSIDLNKIEV